MSVFKQAPPRRAPGRFLQWKLRLFTVGAVLLMIGMAREIDLLVAAALAVLIVAFVLRFFEHDKTEQPADDEEEYDTDEELAPDEAFRSSEAARREAGDVRETPRRAED
ncbi:MAG TPA: hypothetical protein VEX86_23510 [Longimicrobium sp.]|nr:hypothetical protein [Longimicrobium sp.]